MMYKVKGRWPKGQITEHPPVPLKEAQAYAQNWSKAGAEVVISDGSTVIERWINGEIEDPYAWMAEDGNPGNVPLHESLAEIAEWVDYEAEVVKAAAGEIEEKDIAAAAVDQAEAMTEASAALSDAAKSAAETAAEAFVEDGTPAVDKAGEDNPEGQAVGGNPMTEAYKSGYERGKAYDGSPDDAPDPLSGEFAGESMNELLGEGFTEDDADEYEAGYWDAINGNPRDADVETQLKADLGAIDRLIAYWKDKDNAEALADAKSMRADLVKEMSKMGVTDGNPVSFYDDHYPHVKEHRGYTIVEVKPGEIYHGLNSKTHETLTTGNSAEQVERAIDTYLDRGKKVKDGNPIEDVAEVIPDVKPDVAPETMHPYSRIWGKRNA